jgi:hypothetical protein
MNLFEFITTIEILYIIIFIFISHFKKLNYKISCSYENKNDFN